MIRAGTLSSYSISYGLLNLFLALVCSIFLSSSPPCFAALVISYSSGFGGPEVACWHLVPKFAGSHPAEAVGFFRAKKSSARLPSEGK